VLRLFRDGSDGRSGSAPAEEAPSTKIANTLAGVFNRHPELQVRIVHMGGELASILDRLEFTWHLNYNGVRNPSVGKPYKNKLPPSDYFKTNILVDRIGVQSNWTCEPRLKCAVQTEWCSAPVTKLNSVRRNIFMVRGVKLPPRQLELRVYKLYGRIQGRPTSVLPRFSVPGASAFTQFSENPGKNRMLRFKVSHQKK
jgi:hypothetical protein